MIAMTMHQYPAANSIAWPAIIWNTSRRRIDL